MDSSWRVVVRADLEDHVLAALSYKGVTYISGHQVGGGGGVPAPQSRSFLVSAPTRDEAGRIVTETLDTYAVSYGTIAVSPLSDD